MMLGVIWFVGHTRRPQPRGGRDNGREQEWEGPNGLGWGWIGNPASILDRGISGVFRACQRGGDWGEVNDFPVTPGSGDKSEDLRMGWSEWELMLGLDALRDIVLRSQGE